MKIGVIGHGYVGSAVAASYPAECVLINDPALGDQSVSLEQLTNECKAIFVCVPTPQSTSGKCDTSILESVIDKLTDYSGIVIAKSTATPATYKRLEQKYNIKLAHVPEFLTQARAKYDYVNPHKIVVGCKKEIRHNIADVLEASAINFDRVAIEYCSIEEASFFKYMANTMLAMKVIINNEMAGLASELGLNWDTLTNIAKTDYRLGSTHWAVPGPDGQKGYGGACFPKDTAALAAIATEAGVKLDMLSTAMAKNQIIRD